MIESFCARFEEDLARGRRPQIPAFLEQVKADLRKGLLANLLGIEIHWRRIRETSPVQKVDYLRRFPDHSDIVDAVFAKSETAPPPSRQTIQRYGLIQEIGAGGGGCVYLAYDQSLGRHVVLKEIHQDHVTEMRAVARFENEARYMSRLEHPGIPPIYAIGRHGDSRPYYVTKRYSERTLGDALREFHRDGITTVSEGDWSAAIRPHLRCLIHACEAIAHAHSRGILHRDLKPANILLGDHGETIVADWGSAFAIGSDPNRSEPPASQAPEPRFVPGLTLAGEMIGTPGYASPEQFDPSSPEIGIASDVYGLGATFYHLLTGRPPFADLVQGSPILTPTRIARLGEATRAGAFVRPRAINKAVPRSLEAICLRAMEVPPERRYPTVPSMVVDLENWLAGEPISAYREPGIQRLSRRMRRHPRITASLATACLFLLMISVWAMSVFALAKARVRLSMEVLTSATLDQVPALMPLLVRDSEVSRSALNAFIASNRPLPAKRSAAVASLGLSHDQRHWLADQVRGDRDFRNELIDAVVGREPSGVGRARQFRDLLTPLKPDLLPELVAVQQGIRTRYREAERVEAGRALLHYDPGNVALMATALAHAPTSEFQGFLTALERDPRRAKAILDPLVTATPPAPWPEQPPNPDWPPLPPKLLQALAGASGWADEMSALCQSMPLEEFVLLTREAAKSGYRPMRVRPYRDSDQAVRVAAVWYRDAILFRFEHGLTQGEVMERIERHRQDGYVAVDVAAYLDGVPGQVRFASLWCQVNSPEMTRWQDSSSNVHGSELLSAMSPIEDADIRIRIFPPGIPPPKEIPSDGIARSHHVLRTDDGGLVISQVWMLFGLAEERFPPALSIESSYRDLVFHGVTQADAVPVPPSDRLKEASEWQYASAWFAHGAMESTEIHVETPAEHNGRSRLLLAQRYRPISAAVAFAPDGSTRCASVWVRPRITPVDTRPAQRRVHAAVAMLRLGDEKPFWNLLRQSPDPTSRSLAIEHAASLGMPADRLVDGLMGSENFPTSDDSQRAAALLALGAYEPMAIDPERRVRLFDHLTAQLSGEPNPQVRSAAKWLLHQWNLGDRVLQAEARIPRVRTPDPPARWYLNGQGQAFTVVRPEAPFLMGENRFDSLVAGLEARHLVTIDRRFAIGQTEVTNAQFRAYSRDHQASALSGEDQSPVLQVDWLTIAHYCN